MKVDEVARQQPDLPAAGEGRFGADAPAVEQQAIRSAHDHSASLTPAESARRNPPASRTITSGALTSTLPQIARADRRTCDLAERPELDPVCGDGDIASRAVGRGYHRAVPRTVLDALLTIPVSSARRRAFSMVMFLPCTNTLPA